MYEKYHITGIKQSYRTESGPKTVVMPIVIFTLLGAMVTFYVKSRPAEEPIPEPAVVIPSTAPALENVPSGGSRMTNEEPLPIGSPIPVSISTLPGKEGNRKETMPGDEETVSPVLPLVQREGIEESEFTPWMSPLALDIYIRQKNSGFEATFWERGHWIRAVEGRWNDGSHEFRIAIGKNPDPARYGWHYRIDQTGEEFAESLRLREEEGFSLVQSDVYELPDGSSRYQGVWQREVTDSSIVNSSRRLRPLDIGSLNFRQ